LAQKESRGLSAPGPTLGDMKGKKGREGVGRRRKCKGGAAREMGRREAETVRERKAPQRRLGGAFSSADWFRNRSERRRSWCNRHRRWAGTAIYRRRCKD